MKALMVFFAILVTATSQNNDDNSESSTTENNPTTENVPLPDCKCALRPPGNSPFPAPSPPVIPSPPYPNPQPPSYPNFPPPYTINRYQQIPPQSFNRYPPPFPNAIPIPTRSPARRSPRAAPQPYAYQWQPVQPYPSPRDPMPSQGDPVQSYISRGSNYQPDYQVAQGPQQSELSYRGDTHPYWDDSDRTPVQQSPVQQVYYVPDGYYEYDNTPVRQMPVQQVLVMQRH